MALEIRVHSAVFASTLSLPPLVGGGGRLVCESVGKADLLPDQFDIKQSRKSVDLHFTRHLSPSIIRFPFRPSEVRHFLLDLTLMVDRPNEYLSFFSNENGCYSGSGSQCSASVPCCSSG